MKHMTFDTKVRGKTFAHHKRNVLLQRVNLARAGVKTFTTSVRADTSGRDGREKFSSSKAPASYLFLSHSLFLSAKLLLLFFSRERERPHYIVNRFRTATGHAIKRFARVCRKKKGDQRILHYASITLYYTRYIATWFFFLADFCFLRVPCVSFWMYRYTRVCVLTDGRFVCIIVHSVLRISAT